MITATKVKTTSTIKVTHNSHCAHKGCSKVGMWRFKVNSTDRLCDAHYVEYVDAMLEDSRDADYDRSNPFGQGA